MKPCVLNAWSQVVSVEGATPEARGVSRICFESTSPPLSLRVGDLEKMPCGDYVVNLRLQGLGLQMAPDEILVADGLIRKVCVHAPPDAGATMGIAASSESVAVDVILEHPVTPVVRETPGLPHRTEFDFPRGSLRALCAGRTVAVDPGHGGRDIGVRGPVNLLEKDVALDIAKELAAMLRECGANVPMSRETDVDVDSRTWSLCLLASRPDIVVEVHVSSQKDPLAKSYHVYGRTRSGASTKIAREIAGALTERMGITFPGVESMDFVAVPVWPAVRVAPLCLTHFVDEANVRAPLFKKRIARSIFNGVLRYLSKASKGGEESAG